MELQDTDMLLDFTNELFKKHVYNAWLELDTILKWNDFNCVCFKAPHDDSLTLDRFFNPVEYFQRKISTMIEKIIEYFVGKGAFVWLGELTFTSCSERVEYCAMYF